MAQRVTLPQEPNDLEIQVESIFLKNLNYEGLPLEFIILCKPMLLDFIQLLSCQFFMVNDPTFTQKSYTQQEISREEDPFNYLTFSELKEKEFTYDLISRVILEIETDFGGIDEIKRVSLSDCISNRPYSLTIFNILTETGRDIPYSFFTNYISIGNRMMQYRSFGCFRDYRIRKCLVNNDKYLTNKGYRSVGPNQKKILSVMKNYQIGYPVLKQSITKIREWWLSIYLSPHTKIGKRRLVRVLDDFYSEDDDSSCD